MHFFDEYLPSGYYVPGTVLGEGNNMLNRGEISWPPESREFSRKDHTWTHALVITGGNKFQGEAGQKPKWNDRRGVPTLDKMAEQGRTFRRQDI